MSFSSRSFFPFFLHRSSSGGSYQAIGGRPADQDLQQGFFSTINAEITAIGFEPLNTAPALWAQLVTSMVLTLIGFIYTYHGCYSGSDCSGYYLMLYLRAAFWVVTYIGHLYVKGKHNRLKLLGYHKFLRIIHRQKKGPIQLVSLSNLLLLTIHTIVLECFGPSFVANCTVKGLSMTMFVSVWCLVECGCLVSLHTSYYVKMRVFNVLRSPPDALITAENRPRGQSTIAPEDFINQQFLMIVKLMDENRHLQDKIREVRATAHLINSESTHLSLAEQSLFFGF